MVAPYPERLSVLSEVRSALLGLAIRDQNGLHRKANRMTSSFWSVAQTETRREQTAARFLGDQGFVTYLPKIKIAHKRIVPLFPSYLFVRIVDRWWNVNQTIGIISLLTTGDAPARIRDNVVDLIKAKERGGIVRLPDPKRMQIGAKVRIIKGSFEGHFGIYAGMSGKDRERVLLDLLGRKVNVDLASGTFAIVEPPQHLA